MSNLTARKKLIAQKVLAQVGGLIGDDVSFDDADAAMENIEKELGKKFGKKFTEDVMSEAVDGISAYMERTMDSASVKAMNDKKDEEDA